MTWSVAFTVVFGVFGGLIALENLLVFFLVIRYKTLRTFTNGFVLSLAVADFLYGALIIPLYIAAPSSVVNNYLLALVLLANITTLMCVTFDRYMIVLHPFAYDPLMKHHFYKIIIASWLAPITFSLIPLLYSSKYSLSGHKIYVFFIVFLGIVIPYVLILLAYIRIFRRVVSQVQYLARLTSRDDDSEARREGKRVTAEADIARIFAIIAAIFLISWMPVVYMTVVNNIGRKELIPKQLQMVSWFTLSLGSIVNAPIYAFAKKDFNNVLMKIISCKKTQPYLKTDEEEPNTGQQMMTTA